MSATENNSAPGREEAAVLDTAWQWILRLRQPDVSEQDVSEWMSWYEADPAHQQAFDHMQALDQDLPRVAQGPAALPAALWLGDPAAPSSAAPAPSSRPGVRRRSWMALAAGVATLGIAMTLWLRAGHLPVLPDSSTAVVTAPGIRESFLADGSNVKIAAKTEISVEMTERQRTVVLQQGAAYFTVAHNAQRPFIVKAGRFDVRAVGTAFNVRRAGHRTVVTVAQGTVDVYPAGSGGGVRAKAGTEVAWADQGASPVVTSIDPAQALAWTRGSLDYASEPLDSVVADLNRYSTRQIVIRDPAVGELLVWGTVRTDSVEQWVEALPGMFPVTLVTDAQGNLILGIRKDS